MMLTACCQDKQVQPSLTLDDLKPRDSLLSACHLPSHGSISASYQPYDADYEIHPGYPFYVSFVLIAKLLDAGLVGFEGICVDQAHRNQAQNRAGPMPRDQQDAQVDQ